MGLQALARFHAVSKSFMNSYPGGLTAALETYKVLVTDYVCPASQTPEFREIWKMVMGSSFDSTMHFLRLAADEGDNRVDLVEAYVKKNFPECWFDVVNTTNMEHQFKTICHGDAWFNNIMYK